jgi:hypothetical protein
MIFQEYLARTLIAIPFAVAGLLLAWKGSNAYNRFLHFDYAGDRRARFMDSFISSVYFCLAGGFLLTINFLIFGEEVNWNSLVSYLPFTFGLMILGLPIAIACCYLRAFQVPHLLDISSVIRGVSTNNVSLKPSSAGIRRRATLTALAWAVYAFAVIFSLARILGWTFGVRPGLLFQLVISTVYAAGVYLLIIWSGHASRLRQLEAGEPLDDVPVD